MNWGEIGPVIAVVVVVAALIGHWRRRRRSSWSVDVSIRRNRDDYDGPTEEK